MLKVHNWTAGHDQQICLTIWHMESFHYCFHRKRRHSYTCSKKECGNTRPIKNLKLKHFFEGLTVIYAKICTFQISRYMVYRVSLCLEGHASMTVVIDCAKCTVYVYVIYTYTPFTGELWQLKHEERWWICGCRGSTLFRSGRKLQGPISTQS